ncbi:MAG: NAD(P)/FAD-dependent oxidoreductase [Saprospiraceae bacterium]|nr:NAD(P)/FAD-dependent oxidoreductase [Candidatus Opimibacter skivensis]
MNNQNANAYDVIVIGSGPAGTAAASICRKSGMRVLVVTQAAEPGADASISPGPLESIHPGVSSLLEKIGAQGAEQRAARATYHGISVSGTYTSLGRDENGIWEGLHIDRQIFNAQLLRKTMDQDVPILFNETVEEFIQDAERITGIKTKSGDLYATYIIDASGKKAIAGKKLNLHRKFFSPPLLCWTGISGGIVSYPFDPHVAYFMPGDDEWTWLAPQPPDQCAWTRLSMKGDKSLSPPAILKDYPIIGEVHADNMRWRMFQPVCREGIVLCGDAAGVLDPAAGQGIFNALWSGTMAAISVVSCIQQPEAEAFHLAHYNQWYTEHFESKVKQLREYYITQGLTGLTV